MTTAVPAWRVAAWTAAAALSFGLVALVGLTAPSTRGALRSFGTSDGSNAGMTPTLGLLATATVGKGEAPAAIRELIPRTGLPHVFSKRGGVVRRRACCWDYHS